MKPLPMSLMAFSCLSLSFGLSQEALPPGGSEEDGHAEMVRLMQEVEVSLDAIDVGLTSAGIGELPLVGTESTSIAEMLRASMRESDAVVVAIDRILSIRDHHEKSDST